MTPQELKRKRTKLDISQFALSIRSKVKRYKISLFECGYGELTGVEIRSIKNVINKKK